MIAEMPDWLSFGQKHLSIKANTQQVVITLFHHAQRSLASSLPTLSVGSGDDFSRTSALYFLLE